MNNGNYIYLVGDNLLNSFSNVYIIDIKNDVINEYSFENTSVKLKESKSFVTFLENVNGIVDSEDNENFVNILLGKFENSVSTIIKKANIYSNQNYVLIAQKIKNDTNELIMVVLIKTNDVLKESLSTFENDKLLEDFSEVILKIYNTIDLTKEKSPSFEYIKSLLENLNENYPKLNANLEKNIVNEVNKTRNTLLIVDDDVMTRNILKKAFEADFNIVVASNGKEAIDLLEEQNKVDSESRLNFVGIFLDIEMPVLNGFAVLEYLEQRSLLNKMPVIIISGIENKETRQNVYNYNIADMLEKPFNLEIIKLRINNFIKLFKSSNSLSSLIANNDRDINVVINKLKETYFSNYEKNIELVGKLIDILAKKHLQTNINCGLTLPLIDKIIEASKYYDIGKIFVPNKILNKNNLTSEESKLLMDHTLNGGLLIKRLFIGKDPILEEYAYNIAMYHHDTLEDSLYSKKNNNKEIPLYLSIASLAIMYVSSILENNETNHSVIAANIIALENKQFSSELINSFRLVLNEFAQTFQNVI